MSHSQLWHTYQQVVFVCEGLPAFDSEQAIITACNPKGQLLDAQQNESLHQELIGHCEQNQWRFQTLQGCSPDLQHKEQSVLVDLPPQQAIALGIACEQNAIYLLQHGLLKLVPCLLQGVSEVEMGAVTRRLIVN